MHGWGDDGRTVEEGMERWMEGLMEVSKDGAIRGAKDGEREIGIEGRIN